MFCTDNVPKFIKIVPRYQTAGLWLICWARDCLGNEQSTSCNVSWEWIWLYWYLFHVNLTQYMLQMCIDFSQTSNCCELLRNVWIAWWIFTDWKVFSTLANSLRQAFSRNFCKKDLSSLEVTLNLLESRQEVYSHAATVCLIANIVSVPKTSLISTGSLMDIHYFLNL